MIEVVRRAASAPLDPLGAPAGEVGLLGGTLRAHVDAQIAAAGLRLVASAAGPHLVIGDDLFASAALLRQIAALDGFGRIQLTGACGAYVQALGGADLPLWRVAGPGDLPTSMIAHDPGGTAQVARVRHPALAAALGPGFPVSAAVGCAVSHWLHVLLANQLAFASWAVAESERVRGSALAMITEGLRLVWRARSFDPDRLTAAIGTRGARCKVHPTAVVESSILGDDVTIGPHAVVTGSWVGDGVEIAAQSRVVGGILAPRSTVAHGASIFACVVQQGAFVSKGVGHQMSLFGPGSFVAEGVTTYDLSFGGPIAVRSGSERLSTGMRFLGSCVGKDARIGPHVRLGYGETVPEGAFLVADPADLARKIPAKLPDGPVYTRDGAVHAITKRNQAP